MWYDSFFLNASLCVIQGPHDSTLDVQQLFKGTFTIELLNQLSDNDHIANEVILTNGKDCKECSEMSFDNEMVRTCSYPVLLPNDTLIQKSNSDYVRNNSLYFRVSNVNTDSMFMQLFNYYYNYIMCYLIKPSIAGVSVTAAYYLASIFHIHSKEYVLVIIIVYLVGLGISMENSVFKWMYWVSLYCSFCNFLLAGVDVAFEMDLEKLMLNMIEEKHEMFLLVLAQAFAGCTAKVMLDIVTIIVRALQKYGAE